MERNIQKIGWLNLALLLLSGGVAFALARYSHSLAGQVGTLFFGMGFFVALIGLFQIGLESKERLEQLEFDEIARDKNAASLFTTESETFPARRSREQFERFVLPGFTVVLFVVQAVAAYFIWNWLDEVIALPHRQPLVAISLYGVLALVLFLLGKYGANIARFEKQHLVRPGASFMVFGAYLSAAIAIAIGLGYGGVPKADLFLARALAILLGLAALETLLNLILEIYRPRVRVQGQRERLVYESRLLGLLAHPEGIFSSLAQSLDYQFGFKVSETWFYRFLEKALAWLILVQFAVLALSTCFIFIGPGEQGLLERFGRPASAQNILNPGLHLKMPWPADRVYRFRTDEVQTFYVGGAPDEDHGHTIVWNVKHEDEPLNLMVAARDSGPANSGGDTNAPGGVPVNLLTVGIGVQYQIADVRAFAYNHVDAGSLLEKLATREVVKYCVGVDMFEFMSNGKAKASVELAQAIQTEADRLRLGVRILHVGLQDIHPPQKVVESFEKVVGARQEREALVLQAQGYAARSLALARALADKEVREAESYKYLKVANAEAEGKRFENQLLAHRASPDVYVNRAYLQSWMNASTNSRLFVMTSTNSHDVFQFDFQEKINVDMSDIPIPTKK